METPTSRSVEKELFIRATPERVFKALTDKADLEHWYVTKVEIDLHPGGTVRFEWGDDYETGHIVTLEPPQRLGYTWDTMSETPTRITFELAAEGEGTRLYVAHTGIGEGGDWERFYERSDTGWNEELEHLRAWLETGEEKAW